MSDYCAGDSVILWLHSQRRREFLLQLFLFPPLLTGSCRAVWLTFPPAGEGVISSQQQLPVSWTLHGKDTQGRSCWTTCETKTPQAYDNPAVHLWACSDCHYYICSYLKLYKDSDCERPVQIYSLQVSCKLTRYHFRTEWKTSYIVYVVHTSHVLCKPREGWTSTFVKSVDKKKKKVWPTHTHNVQAGRGHILSWEILTAPSRQRLPYILILLHSVALPHLFFFSFLCDLMQTNGCPSTFL